MKYNASFKMSITAILGMHLTACCCTDNGPLDSVRTTDVGYVNAEYAPINSTLDDYTMQLTTNDRIKDQTRAIARVTPVKAKDSDQQWVSAQPTNAYTIELARDVKASRVANVLYQAPKNERMAEVASASGYVGVYGSYQTAEEAQRAYAALPESIRTEAKIKSWGEVH
jgi:septal ring-binding cell division protein DamX